MTDDEERARALLRATAPREPQLAPDPYGRLMARVGRRRRTRATAASGFAVAAVALAAVLPWQLSGHGARQGAMPAATAAGSPSPTTGQGVPPLPGALCSALDLRASYLQMPYGTLKWLTEIRLTNTGHQACRLEGYAAVDIREQDGGPFASAVTMLSPSVALTDGDQSTPASGLENLSIRPGGYALILVVTRTDPNRLCGAAEGQHTNWRITLPHEAGLVVLNDIPAPGCVGMSVGVSPILASVADSSSALSFPTPSQTESMNQPAAVSQSPRSGAPTPAIDTQTEAVRHFVETDGAFARAAVPGPGERMYCAVTIVGRSSDGAALYAYFVCERFLKHADQAIMESGASAPVLFHVRGSGANTKVLSWRLPGDGDLYGPSIEAMFPPDIAAKMLQPTPDIKPDDSVLAARAQADVDAGRL